MIFLLSVSFSHSCIFLCLGTLELPAGSTKPPEQSQVVQIFFVTDCQDGAVELALADPRVEEWDEKIAQRILLSKGDVFYVPPANIFQLHNHSKVKTAKLNYTLIRRMEEIDQEQMGSKVSNATKKTSSAVKSQK